MNEHPPLPPFTPRLITAIQRATDIARSHGVDTVGTEHLIQAILEDPRALPTQVVAERCDTAELVERLNSVMESPGYRARP